MKKRQVCIDKLITPKAYAEKIGVTPAAITRQMNEERVDFIQIEGGRIIVLP